MFWITEEGIWITLLGDEQQKGRAKPGDAALDLGFHPGQSRIASNIKLSFKGDASLARPTPYAPASTYPTTANAYDGIKNGGSDVFLSTIGLSGRSLPYSTFLGGGDNDTGYGIKIGQSDLASLTGRSQSVDFPTKPGSFDPFYNGVNDVFVSSLAVPITSRTFLPSLRK